LVTKNSRTDPGHQKYFPGPCRKPAVFKYSDSQPLGGLGEAPPAGSGPEPGRKSIFHTCSPENVPGGNSYGYFRLQKHVYLKLKTAIRINCLTFARLSSTKVIFQNYPGPGNFSIKIPGLSRSFQEVWEPWPVVVVANQ